MLMLLCQSGFFCNVSVSALLLHFLVVELAVQIAVTINSCQSEYKEKNQAFDLAFGTQFNNILC